MGKHSVVMQYDRCLGCPTCIKGCPTDAIRVRNRKAVILNQRCIDCGKCIQVCPHNAIRSISDPFELLEQYKYTVALPEPALFGQFHNLKDPNIVLGALLKIGFDDVFEVAAAAELISDLARRDFDPSRPLPRITSACPTVLRIIRMRFPKLIPHIEPVILPMELAAQLARAEAVRKTGLSPEEIGVFAIVPCSAKVTTAHSPITLTESVIDGAFAIQDIYLKLLSPMKEVALDPPDLSRTGALGLNWGYCGGESAARVEDNFVTVDGIENVIRILEEIEDERLPDAHFIELTACVQGCVGGCLNVENPYGAKMRLTQLAATLPPRKNTLHFTPNARRLAQFRRELDYIPAFQLDSDRGAAMEKLSKIDHLAATLPGLDCSSCGAPSCRALAEDIVLGRASPDDCIFRVRARMDTVSGGEDSYLPAPFRHRKLPEKEVTP